MKKPIRVHALPKTKISNKKTLIPFLENLENISPNSPLLMVVPPFHAKFDFMKFPLVFSNLYKEEYSAHAIEDLILTGCDLDITLTTSEINRIEAETRSQSKCSEWFLFRTGRVTASKAKGVCRVRRLDSNISLIRSLCYPRRNSFQNAATQWGCNHENDALQAYCKIMKESHPGFSLIQCGLFVHPDKPFLAASPDALSKCNCCGIGTVEVKCPFCVAEDGPVHAVKYLLENEDRIFQLSKEHEYYYQVQTQMLCTTYEHSDFFVWSPNGDHIERIFPDEPIQKSILENAELFFYNAVLPELLGRVYTREHE